MKYQELYNIGQSRLKAAQIEEAALDARLLLEYVCDTNRNDLLAHGNREIGEYEEKQYLMLIESREKHRPLQYITGNVEFMGFSFAVNENVLIPRADTEILVEEVMRDLHDGMEILDMCTGSGCILLSLLRYSNDCKGLGVDISNEALEVARRNATSLECRNAEFLKSDLFDKVEGKFDRIVSNPPYIKTSVISDLMEEVKCFEPKIALDGMEDGLFFYRKIVSEATEYLHHGGKLYFEIGFDQADAVYELMEKQGYVEIEVLKDYAGLDRVIYGTYY